MATVALAVHLAVALILAPLGVEARPPAKVHRIGFLGLPSVSSFGKQVEALRAGLRELGCAAYFVDRILEGAPHPTCPSSGRPSSRWSSTSGRRRRSA